MAQNLVLVRNSGVTVTALGGMVSITITPATGDADRLQVRFSTEQILVVIAGSGTAGCFDLTIRSPLLHKVRNAASGAFLPLAEPGVPDVTKEAFPGVPNFFEHKTHFCVDAVGNLLTLLTADDLEDFRFHPFWSDPAFPLDKLHFSIPDLGAALKGFPVFDGPNVTISGPTATIPDLHVDPSLLEGMFFRIPSPRVGEFQLREIRVARLSAGMLELTLNTPIIELPDLPQIPFSLLGVDVGLSQFRMPLQDLLGEGIPRLELALETPDFSWGFDGAFDGFPVGLNLEIQWAGIEGPEVLIVRLGFRVNLVNFQQTSDRVYFYLLSRDPAAANEGKQYFDLDAFLLEFPPARRSSVHRMIRATMATSTSRSANSSSTSSTTRRRGNWSPCRRGHSGCTSPAGYRRRSGRGPRSWPSSSPAASCSSCKTSTPIDGQRLGRTRCASA